MLDDDLPVEENYGEEENNFLEMTKNIESAISKFDLKDNIVVYRRADISFLNYFEKILQSGGIFKDDGFISTTTLKIGSSEEEIEIVIKVPKGKGYGAYIAPMSACPEECEFLLNRGTLFKVRDINKNDFGNFQVFIEVVGRGFKELV